MHPQARLLAEVELCLVWERVSEVVGEENMESIDIHIVSRQVQNNPRFVNGGAFISTIHRMLSMRIRRKMFYKRRTMKLMPGMTSGRITCEPVSCTYLYFYSSGLYF